MRPAATRITFLAVMETPSAPVDRRTGLMARLRAALGGNSDTSVTKRLAGTIFVIRVVSAALAYLSQILLARWMGGSDYGVYVYVWTWVLLLGSMLDFGISASAQKISASRPRRKRSFRNIGPAGRTPCCAAFSVAAAG